MSSHPFDEPEIPAGRAKWRGLAWIVLAVACGLAFSAGLPRMAKWIPWSFEKRMARALGGAPFLAKVCGGEGAAGAALRKLVARIYPLGPTLEATLGSTDPDLPISVELLEGPTVNAFAFLGGKIYVFEGLLEKAESPEELAGVLAHELEHVRHRHVVQGIFVRLVTTEMLKVVLSGGTSVDPNVASALMNLRFTRGQESEADEAGLRRLRAAKVDARGVETFFARLAREGADGGGGIVPAILSDHPDSGERARLAAQYRGYPTEPILSPAEWAALRAGCR